MMATSEKKPSTKKTVKCSCKGVSSQKNKVSPGIAFDREDIDLDVADSIMNGAIMDVKIIPSKDVEGQKNMFDEKAAVEFKAECGSLSVHPTYISASFKINKSGCDLNALDRFSFKVSKAVIARSGDAKPEKEGDEDVPGQRRIGDDPEN